MKRCTVLLLIPVVCVLVLCTAPATTDVVDPGYICSHAMPV